MKNFLEIERDRFLDKARSSDPLSAVFFLEYSNKKLGIREKQLSIDIRSELNHIDTETLKLARKSAVRLLSVTYVGAAYFKYPDSMEYDQAIDRLKSENPGYNEDCYKIAIWESITAMR